MNGSGIENAYIPKKCTLVESGVFSKCDNLKNINVDEENTMYTSIDGVLYSKDKKKLIQYPNGRENNIYTVFNETEVIEESAFLGSKNLTEIVLNNNINKICSYSFIECENLEKINIPTSLKEIPFNTFGSKKLHRIYIPINIEVIKNQAFLNCTDLTIDCEAESKPEAWEDNWYKLAKAVNWGVTN